MTPGEAPRSQRMRSYARPFMVLALMAIAAVASMLANGVVFSPSSLAASTGTPAVVKLGAPAPDMAFTTVDGSERLLSEFRGRPVMLWLFATWCPTCAAGTIAVAGKFDRLRQAGVQIIQLRLYNNLGYQGPSVKDFAERYLGSLAPSPEWLWGEASQEGSYTYDPRGYPDIYFLIDGQGIVRAADLAPHVTMDKILSFAESVQ